jgi:non-homologous end joining protein Ku
MATSPRTFAKDIRLTLGLAGTTGNLKPLRSSEKADSFCILCPTCPTPTKVEQRLVCEHGHGPFLPADCEGRGKKVGDVLYSLTGAEVEAARKSDHEGTTLELRVHPADQVEAMTRPTGIAYAFLPTSAKDQFYAILCELVDSLGTALIGVLVLRNKEKLFRLVREPHGLSLVELCRPQELYTFEAVEGDFDPALMDMARKMVEGAMRDFDPAEYADGTAARVDAILQAKANGTPVPIESKRVEEPVGQDLLAALEASLAAVKGEAA